VISFLIRALAKRHDKFRAAAVAPLNPCAAAMSLGDLPDDRKPGPGSFNLAAYGALKKLKNSLGVLRRHAGTAIAH
jgi:hypothetical protein